MDMEIIWQVGMAAAHESGQILKSFFGRDLNIEKKGAIDLVTQADLASEKAIIETIRKHFPDHGILAEESGLKEGVRDYQWIIDPLDGTTNFAHRLPLFSVSIALSIKGKISFGVVFNPISEELFSAVSGEGAKLNGRKIAVSETAVVSESLLVTGFPYNHKELIDILQYRFNRCLSASQGLRRLGSAAMDLCYVACGRFDGFWEQNLKPWDTAAGYLIAKEAGAVSTDFSNQPFAIDKKEILTTNGKIHKEMLSLLEIKE